MAYRVTLTFVMDGSEEEAWDVADGLEQAAIRKNYREVNGYAQASDARGNVLTGTEAQPGPETSAMTIERNEGNEPMRFGGPDGGMITLGDEHGRSAG